MKRFQTDMLVEFVSMQLKADSPAFLLKLVSLNTQKIQKRWWSGSLNINECYKAFKKRTRVVEPLHRASGLNEIPINGKPEAKTKRNVTSTFLESKYNLCQYLTVVLETS